MQLRAVAIIGIAQAINHIEMVQSATAMKPHPVAALAQGINLLQRKGGVIQTVAA